MPKSQLHKFLLFLGVITLLIQPWRASFTQDDAAYAVSIVNMIEGGVRHAGTIAMNAPQFALGAVAVLTAPSSWKLASLNTLTWLIFVLYVTAFGWLLFGKSSQKDTLARKWWVLLVSFFGFPLFFQYGAIYHGETYAAAILVALLFWLSRTADCSSKFLEACGGFLISFALGTQLQNLAAFPFFWGAFMLLQNRNAQPKTSPLRALSIMVGGVSSSLAFFLMPHTPYQASYSYWLTNTWKQLGGDAPLFFVCSLLQLFIALGIFLIPFLKYTDRGLKSFASGAGAHALVFFALYNAPIKTLSAGVFFTDYFPRAIGTLFVSMGVWGWWGILPYLRKLGSKNDHVPVYGTLAALAVMFVFYVYRYCLDLRYLITLSIPIFFHLRKALTVNSALGQQKWYAALVVSVSLLLNLYLLNTTEMRWRTADALVAQGIPKNEISAGYGWNSFYTASPCMYAVIDKLKAQLGEQDLYKRKEFFDRLINMYGRSHEDGWVPRYLIKPSKVFGYSINLTKNRISGQDKEPLKLINYKVLGVIPNQLSVVRNSDPMPAWCDLPN